jgi:hypothetical protein
VQLSYLSGIDGTLMLIFTLTIPNDTTMNLLRSWREQKILLKRMFSNLTDEDFVYQEGEKEFMLKKLGDKLGKSRTELDLIFAEIQLS